MKKLIDVEVFRASGRKGGRKASITNKNRPRSYYVDIGRKGAESRWGKK